MSATAWVALLDGFERELDEPAGGLSPWTPPATPLPAELADRARRVLERQHEQMTRTRSELDETRDHLEALRRVPAARTDAPAYLDMNG